MPFPKTARDRRDAKAPILSPQSSYCAGECMPLLDPDGCRLQEPPVSVLIDE